MAEHAHGSFYGFDHVEIVTSHGDFCNGEYREWLLEREPNAAQLVGAANQLTHDYVCPQAVRTSIPEELYSTTYIAERAEAWAAVRVPSAMTRFIPTRYVSRLHRIIRRQPRVFVTDEKITMLEEILPLLEAVLESVRAALTSDDKELHYQGAHAMWELACDRGNHKFMSFTVFECLGDMLRSSELRVQSLAAATIWRLAEHEVTITRLPTEQEIKDTYIKKYDREYGPTYLVLDVLQKVFYTNNGAREAFVDMCDSEYVQRCTFDSYLYKKVVDPNPVEDVKLLFGTIGSLIKGAATAKPDAVFSNPVESLKRI